MYLGMIWCTFAVIQTEAFVAESYEYYEITNVERYQGYPNLCSKESKIEDL